MFDVKTMQDCMDLIEREIGLENSPHALSYVDSKTSGAWSAHIEDLSSRMATFPYFMSSNVRAQVHTWHYEALEKFIKIYQDGLHENIISETKREKV